MTISFSILLNQGINLKKEQERKSPFRNYNIPRPSNIGSFFSNWWKSYTSRRKKKKKKKEA